MKKSFTRNIFQFFEQTTVQPMQAPAPPRAPIIGITGKIGAGKDTAAQIIKELYPEFQFQTRSFAARLKQAVAAMAGLPIDTEFTHELKDTRCEALGMTYRHLLQKLGVSARKSIGDDVWVDLLLSEKQANQNWIITDVRFPNEYEKIVRAGGIVLRIARSHNPHPASTHESETALDSTVLPTVHNNGDLKHLRRALIECLADAILPVPKSDAFGDL